MTSLSDDIVRSMADLVAIGELTPGAQVAGITDLVITRARNLNGLEGFESLTTLSIISADAPTYASLAALRSLRVLVIEHSTLGDVATLPMASLRVLRLRHNRVSSLVGLDSATQIQVLDVAGNPLDAASRDLVDKLGANGVLCTRDDDAVAELNVTMLAAGSPYVCSGTEAACVLTLTGLAITSTPERVMANTTIDAASHALATGTLQDLARKGSSP